MNRLAFFIRIAFLILCLHASSLFAQDTIVKRNDEIVLAKILEVNPADIKYKRFDYQDGPTFTVVKWDLKYIIYGNGSQESFENFSAPLDSEKLIPAKPDLSIQPTGRLYYFKNQKIAEQNMLDIAWKLQDKKINLLIKKTEEKKAFKNCFELAAIVSGTVGVLTYAGVFSAYTSKANASTLGKGHGASQRAARIKRQNESGYMILGGMGCELISVGFHLQEVRHAHMVVDLYNQSILQR